MRTPRARDEIRLLALRSLRGGSFWATWPVTRIDLAIGEFDRISSAARPRLTDALVTQLPGLIEHRCSVGVRGGFVLRLEEGTYAPHIVEHVALELQSMIGHDVGFGRARGGGSPGEYTVVMEHRHAIVGRRAALLALDIVRRVLDDRPFAVDPALAELHRLAAGPDLPPPRRRAAIGVLGGRDGSAVAREVRRRAPSVDAVVPVAPADLLTAGLPYLESDLAVVVDREAGDVPNRYGERDRILRFAATMAEAVRPGGLLVIPAHDDEIREVALRSGRRVATFGEDPDTTSSPATVVANGWIEGERVVLRTPAGRLDGGTLHDRVAPRLQVAAAVAASVIPA